MNRAASTSGAADVSATSARVQRGVTPIESATAWPVVADERIVGRRIAMGAGAAGRIAFVDADALVAAYGAAVTDISAEEPPH